MSEYLDQLITSQELHQCDAMANLADYTPATVFRIMNPSVRRDRSCVDPVLHREWLPLGEEALHLGNERREAAVETYSEEAATRLLRIKDSLQPLLVDGQGLLYEDCFPSSQGVGGELRMRAVAGRDHHRVDQLIGK